MEEYWKTVLQMFCDCDEMAEMCEQNSHEEWRNTEKWKEQAIWWKGQRDYYQKQGRMIGLYLV